MTHQSEKERIAARLDHDRAALKASATELRSQLTLGTVTRKVAGVFAAGTWWSAGLVARGARANPFGFALIGAGLAWILHGPKWHAKPVPPVDTSRWEGEGGLVVEPVEADQWSDELDTLRNLVSDQLRKLDLDARSGVTDTYGKLRDFAAERAEIVKQFASDLALTLGIGLENMSEIARSAAVKAREQSYVARIEAERLARKANRLTQDHPVMMVTAALGIGLALAAIITRPKSRNAERKQVRKDLDEEMTLREAAVTLRENRLAAADMPGRRATRR
ncbi:MAG: hypothetical protein H7245_11065 [Candidatus Saccharibacteria bacterium]|nr:hypothetical protein [Pseudorhodobacter sp.]